MTLKGTAEANSTVTVFDNSITKLGAATTNSSGAWTYATGALANGSQSFTATATPDGAANVSPASSALVVLRWRWQQRQQRQSGNQREFR